MPPRQVCTLQTELEHDLLPVTRFDSPLMLQQDFLFLLDEALIKHQGPHQSRHSSIIKEEQEILLQQKRRIKSCHGGHHVPALFAVYIPGVDIWQKDCVSREHLDP